MLLGLRRIRQGFMGAKAGQDPSLQNRFPANRTLWVSILPAMMSLVMQLVMACLAIKLLTCRLWLSISLSLILQLKK